MGWILVKFTDSKNQGKTRDICVDDIGSVVCNIVMSVVCLRNWLADPMNLPSSIAQKIHKNI